MTLEHFWTPFVLFIISVLRLATGIPKIIFMSKACFLSFRITHLLSLGKSRENEVTTQHVPTGRQHSLEQSLMHTVETERFEG